MDDEQRKIIRRKATRVNTPMPTQSPRDISIQREIQEVIDVLKTMKKKNRTM